MINNHSMSFHFPSKTTKTTTLFSSYSTSTTYKTKSKPFKSYRARKSYGIFRKSKNMDDIMNFSKYNLRMRLIIEEARRNGPRRSPRFSSSSSCSSPSTISSSDNEEITPITTKMVLRSKRLLDKNEKESEELNNKSNKRIKSDQNNVDINDARRLVKKSIARNKLNSK